MHSITFATLVVWSIFSGVPALGEPAVQDFATAGCSGGVTGGGSGGIVRRDGTIIRWSKATIRELVTEEIVQSDVEEAFRLAAGTSVIQETGPLGGATYLASGVALVAGVACAAGFPASAVPTLYLIALAGTLAIGALNVLGFAIGYSGLDANE